MQNNNNSIIIGNNDVECCIFFLSLYRYTWILILFYGKGILKIFHNGIV